MKQQFFIYAKRGKLRSRFSEMIWTNMGKDKFDWEIDAEKMRQEYGSKSDHLLPETTPVKSVLKKVKGEISHAQRYRILIDQAKGFETDGELQKALGKYTLASLIKNPKTLVKKIETLQKKVSDALEVAGDALEATGDATEATEESLDEEEVLSSARRAVHDGKFEDALELFNSVEDPDESVLAEIDNCVAALEQ